MHPSSSTTLSDPVEALPGADAQTLERLRSALHPRCFACGQGLFRLEFSVCPGGGIEAEFAPASFFSGYEGAMHGGALALFCDQAAACCLFAHGRAAVTARLDLRYRRSVEPGPVVRLRARVTEVRGPLHRVDLTAEQNGRIVLSGRAEMWRKEGVADLIEGISAPEKEASLLSGESSGVT